MTKLALITVLDDFGGGHPSTGPIFPSRPVDPNYGFGGGLYPSQGLPVAPGHPSGGFPVGPGHIGNWVPGGNYPSTGPIWLPVFPSDPTRPDNTLPTPPLTPDNSLPQPPASTKPIEPGDHFVLKCTMAFGLILVRVNEPGVNPT